MSICFFDRSTLGGSGPPGLSCFLLVGLLASICCIPPVFNEHREVREAIAKRRPPPDSEGAASEGESGSGGPLIGRGVVARARAGGVHTYVSILPLPLTSTPPVYSSASPSSNLWVTSETWMQPACRGQGVAVRDMMPTLHAWTLLLQVKASEHYNEDNEDY